MAGINSVTTDNSLSRSGSEYFWTQPTSSKADLSVTVVSGKFNDGDYLSVNYKADPYCKVRLSNDNAYLCQTDIVPDDNTPRFNKTCPRATVTRNDDLSIACYDEDDGSDELMGLTVVSLSNFFDRPADTQRLQLEEDQFVIVTVIIQGPPIRPTNTPMVFAPGISTSKLTPWH